MFLVLIDRDYGVPSGGSLYDLLLLSSGAGDAGQSKFYPILAIKREHKRLSAMRRVRSIQNTLWLKFRAIREKEALQKKSADYCPYALKDNLRGF